MIPPDGVTLAHSSTFQQPANDPGLRMKLKRNYSGQECFDKFYPYLLWLLSFINRNKWVSPDVTKQFKALWDTYTLEESRLGKITAIREFFSQEAHAEVEHLWRRYRTLRKDIEALATQRVTMRAAQAADRMAISELTGSNGTSGTTGDGNGLSPEHYSSDPRDPFLDAQSGPRDIFSDPQSD
ncbi:hypothetical protein FRC01_000198 [Tulasnella sp. 417]|nr:hypothetical protein FRC01_000198 [Tulasnella sp. 417]